MSEDGFHLLAIVALLSLCGFGFASGVIFACRWLKWAPINLTINNHFPNASGSSVEIFGAEARQSDV